MNPPVWLAEHIRQVQSLYGRLRTRVDDEKIQRLSLRLHAWMRYRQFLDIIVERHDLVQKASADAWQPLADISAYMEPGSENRPADPKELEGLRRTYELERVLHLDIESFYLFAKILLDRMAETYALYFGVRLKGWGSTHTQLSNKLESLQPNPESLKPTVDELNQRVLTYRNQWIEHPTNPRMTMNTMILGGGPARLYPMVRWPTAAEVDRLQRPSEDPHDLLALIDKYMAGTLSFFETHAAEANLDESSSKE